MLVFFKKATRSILLKWIDENPHAVQEEPVHSQKCTVWCQPWARGITDPYFSEDEAGTQWEDAGEHIVSRWNRVPQKDTEVLWSSFVWNLIITCVLFIKQILKFKLENPILPKLKINWDLATSQDRFSVA